MACSNVSSLCNNIVISQDVTFADGTLAINIPAGSYANGQKYCIVIAQEIPTDTTISANVVITIGDEDTTYPLVNCNGTNVQAAAIQPRTRYATRVATNIGSGVFKLLSNINCNICNCNSAAPALPIAAATPAAAAPEALSALLPIINSSFKGGENK